MRRRRTKRLLRSNWKHLLATGLVLCCLGGAGTGRAIADVPAGPNVLLVLVDTLRPDHLGCYGYGRATSPNLDAFAAESLVFQNCFSHAPETTASCSAILSGSLPHETTVVSPGSLPQGVQTLAETLRQDGYRTAAVICNYVLRSGMGFEQGFEIYDDTLHEREIVRDVPERIAGAATDRAVALLDELQGERFFMWIHYQDPHGPYTPPDEYAAMFGDADVEPRRLRLNPSESGIGGIPDYQRLGDHRDYHYYVSQYDGEIRYWDAHFGRLIAALKQRGLYDETLIVFSSDHGEGMGEQQLFFAHGENLHNSLIRVPLIVSHGERLRGRRTDYAQHLDIVPTILAAAGLPLDARLRGSDLRRELPVARNIVAARPGQWSLISGGMKLFCAADDPIRPVQLYNLRKDFYESQNIINRRQYSDRIEAMQTILDRVRQNNRLGIEPANDERQLSDEEKKKLRALGYVR